jgi:hypothetical protein
MSWIQFEVGATVSTPSPVPVDRRTGGRGLLRSHLLHRNQTQGIAGENLSKDGIRQVQ